MNDLFIVNFLVNVRTKEFRGCLKLHYFGPIRFSKRLFGPEKIYNGRHGAKLQGPMNLLHNAQNPFPPINFKKKTNFKD